MKGGVSDPWLREAIQGGLKGRKNDYVAEGCGVGVVKRVGEGCNGVRGS
jgi:hypothetical protein